jgi:hypothetical protein
LASQQEDKHLAKRLRDIKFVVGRVNFVDWTGPLEDYDNKRAFLLDALEKGKEWVVFDKEDDEKVKHSWLVTDITVDEKRDVVFGRLVKEREEKGTHKIDRKRRKVTFDEAATQTNISLSSFAINLRNHVILFEANSKISRPAFEEAFAELYNPSQGLKSPPIEIDTIVNEEKIATFVKRVDRVTGLRIEIIPSNPEPKEANIAIDAGIKSINAQKVIIKIQGNKNDPESSLHLDPEKKDFYDQALSHAAGGYGKFTIDAVDEGEKVSLTSSKDFASIIVEQIDAFADNFIGMLAIKVKEAEKFFK